MSEMEDITDKELDKYFGKLNIVDSSKDRQDMSEEPLNVFLVPADDTLSKLGMAH